MNRQQLIETYVELKADIRIQDAEQCSSMREEFEFCYRHGLPSPEDMSDKELEANIESCKLHFLPDYD